MPTPLEMAQALGGQPYTPWVASDAIPDEVKFGQQYAGPKKMFNPLDSFSPIIPDPNALLGGVAGAAPLPMKNPFTPPAKWKPSEIRDLEVMKSQGMSIGDIVKALGGERTYSAVANKLSEMGLSTPQAPVFLGRPVKGEGQ